MAKFSTENCGPWRLVHYFSYYSHQNAIYLTVCTFDETTTWRTMNTWIQNVETMTKTWLSQYGTQDNTIYSIYPQFHSTETTMCYQQYPKPVLVTHNIILACLVVSSCKLCMLTTVSHKQNIKQAIVLSDDSCKSTGDEDHKDLVLSWTRLHCCHSLHPVNTWYSFVTTWNQQNPHTQKAKNCRNWTICFIFKICHLFVFSALTLLAEHSNCNSGMLDFWNVWGFVITKIPEFFSTKFQKFWTMQ